MGVPRVGWVGRVRQSQAPDELHPCLVCAVDHDFERVIAALDQSGSVLVCAPARYVRDDVQVPCEDIREFGIVEDGRAYSEAPHEGVDTRACDRVDRPCGLLDAHWRLVDVVVVVTRVVVED